MAIAAVLLFTNATQSASGENSNSLKTRLPETINSYSPTIVPVISPDGDLLFFDRKNHPLNTGSVADNDEIWYSKKISGKYWSLPKKAPSPPNEKYSTTLFWISPCGASALIYGDSAYDSRSANFYLTDMNGANFSNSINVKIRDYYNKSKNAYAILSHDAEILVLSLKRGEGFGGEDLYVCFKSDTGLTYSEPLNIGSEINTESDEISPFLAYDNKTLYFASAGRDGFGGFDLYVAKRLDDSWTNWSEPKNLGGDINSKFEEGGIYLTLLSKYAYLVSSEIKVAPSNSIDKNLDSIKLRHGIYKTKIPNKFAPEPYAVVEGEIKVKAVGEELHYKKSVEIEAEFKGRAKKNIYRSSPHTGEFVIVLQNNQVVDLKINEPGYEIIKKTVSARNLKRPEKRKIEIILQPAIERDKPIAITLFEKNSYSIPKTAEKKIYEALATLDNPNDLNYKIIGHADESGTSAYNLGLSLKRAKAVARYLNKLGVSEKNIKLEAKGETSPSSTEARLNRRAEIFIAP